MAAVVGSRQRHHRRFVGVPDFHRLWPDADTRRPRGARCSRARRLDVSNGFTDVDALFDALHALSDADDEGGLSILEHSLQCAELLRADHPDDVKLQVPGLVHDLGWLERDGGHWTLRLDAAHD